MKTSNFWMQYVYFHTHLNKKSAQSKRIKTVIFKNPKHYFLCQRKKYLQ